MRSQRLAEGNKSLSESPAPKLRIRLGDVVLGNWQDRTRLNWQGAKQAPRAKRDSDAAAFWLLKATEMGMKFNPA